MIAKGFFCALGTGKVKPFKGMQVTLSRSLIHAGNGMNGTGKVKPFKGMQVTLSMNTQRIELAVARFENNRAAAPYSRSSIPRPGLKSGWNVEAPLEADRADTGHADLPPDVLAEISARLTLAQGSRKAFTPQPCAPAVTSEDFKKIPMSFSPPRFKVQKNGKTVEEKWLIRQLTRTVSFAAAGGVTKEWKTTAKLKGEAAIPPSSGPGGKCFSVLRAEFTGRWGANRAAELVKFLRFA